MDYKLLQKNDEDLLRIKKIHNMKENSKFISISDNYFDYVTTNNDVYYYKIHYNNDIIGGLHLEIKDNILYLLILIDPLYQHKGSGTKVIKDVIENKFNLNFNKIIVGIDSNNSCSIKLFEKIGFMIIDKDENIINYQYEMFL